MSMRIGLGFDSHAFKKDILTLAGSLISAGAETETHAGSRIVGQPPRWEGGYWREGFIALPLPPKTARSAVRSIRWTD